MNPIVRGFKSLLKFNGRDRAGQFWPYAGVVIAITMVLGVVVVVPGIVSAVEQAAVFAEANPDKAVVHRTPTSVRVEIRDATGMPPMDMSFAKWMAVPAGALVLLLAAAVTRRLHDRNLSGAIGLVPVVAGGIYLFLWFKVMNLMLAEAAGQGEMNGAFAGLFLTAMLTCLLYLASAAILIVLLCLKGKAGPNRYGPEPA